MPETLEQIAERMANELSEQFDPPACLMACKMIRKHLDEKREKLIADLKQQATNLKKLK